MASLITKESFLSAAARTLRVSNPILILGNKVQKYRVRELSAADKAKLEDYRWKRATDGGYILDLPNDDINHALACLCDDEGKPLFSIDNIDDRKLISALPSDVVEAIADEAKKINDSGEYTKAAAGK